MSDNNQKPDAWGQNKNIPDSWGKNNKLPENWGKQSSNADSGTPSGGTKITSSSSVENTANLSDKAKSGIGLLAGAAKKVGGAAKNAAGNAVEYAKSDDVKDKLNAAKNKAKSIADGAGSSLADMKEKTSNAINERRVSKSELSDDNTSDEIIEDTLDTAIAEDSSIVDSFDDASIEDDEMSAEPSAEADTVNYAPDEADDEVYETEQEEEYAYAGNDVVEETSSGGNLKKSILIGAAVLAVGIGTIIGVGLIFKKGDKKPNSNDSSIETTAETSTAATSTVTTAETTTSKAQSSTTTVVTTSESDKSYTLEKNSVKIKIGETTNVNILHYPEGCDEINEYWTSNDYNIASVNVHGYITGVSSGECIVSISCKDNPAIKTDISVVVVDEDSTQSTEPTKHQPDAQLGMMYNKFFISSLSGGSSGGYIEDYNGDGVDDLICWRANAGYVVTYYKNDELVYDTIPNTFGYAYNEPLFGMKTEYYDGNTLREKCREKAIDCGFTINKDFYMGSTNAIGYVNTSDINSTLNVRSAPSTDSDVLVQIPNGKLFNVIPESTGQYGVYNNKGWYYISVNQDSTNYMGYISADYAIAWDNAI
ncbi:SH3 domain-containing protein [Ruminococcus sp. YRD2003]|uniref:SH3 domain-containing protein n=1 Tax=Ruminococcus sp. YRD2003 TaxID=1452313 RepID=UPI0008CAC4F6|nr:SH3 domain-containing protein [Ruminococcus flavefaciens]